jgi:hypothetical protein
MRRKYIHRVEVWVNATETDNFSGNTLDPSLLSSSWCNVTTIPLDKLVAYGLDITQQAITIKTRWRSDLDYFQNGLFFKYKGIEWFPNRVYNKDLINEEIVIIANAINE